MHSPPIRWSVGLAFLLGTTPLYAAERGTPPLDALYSHNSEVQTAMCVNARRLAEGPDSAAWTWMPDYLRASLERNFASQEKYLREAAAGGKAIVLPERFTARIERRQCITSVLATHTYNLGEAPQSFAGLVAEAEGIVAGRIVAIHPMLCDVTPVNVLEVEAIHTFRASPLHARGVNLLVYHPFARFAFGGHSFCNAVSNAEGESATFDPALGGRVLLFVFGEPNDRERRFLLPRPEQVVYESPGGELSLPALLRRDDETHPAESLDEVEELLINALRGVGRPDDDLGEGGAAKESAAAGGRSSRRGGR